MKAFLILEDGTVLTGESFGAAREVISEVVFNTSMTGYLEILTDPSYAGQSVVMTYPLIGNYGICMEDMESIHPWPKALIVRECAKLASNFRNEMTLDEFLKKYDVPGISGIDTRHLTRILREYGVMNGMITTREDFDLDEVVKQLKEYKVQGVVREVSCKEKRVLPGDGFKVALMDFGAKKNIEKSLNKRGCEVTVYPAYTKAEEIIAANPDGIMLSNGPGDPKECVEIIEELKKLFATNFWYLSWTSAHGTCQRRRYKEDEIRTSWSQPPGKRFKNRKGLYFLTEPWIHGNGRFSEQRYCRSKLY